MANSSLFQIENKHPCTTIGIGKGFTCTAQAEVETSDNSYYNMSTALYFCFSVAVCLLTHQPCVINISYEYDGKKQRFKVNSYLSWHDVQSQGITLWAPSYYLACQQPTKGLPAATY